MIRIHKILAQNGIGSRRNIESLISQQRIKVNGIIAELGMLIGPEDVIAIDNKKIKISWETNQTEVLVFNKPVGTLCSTKSQGGNETVFSYLQSPKSGKWSLVGRLDLDTSGLLLVTNSGDLAHKLMHPKSNIPRFYIVQVLGQPSSDIIQKTKKGILDNGELLIFSSIEKVSSNKNSSTYKVCLHQGKNREIRRIWQSIGHKVIKLHRYRYGPVTMPKSLPAGHSIVCSKEEIEKLEQL